MKTLKAYLLKQKDDDYFELTQLLFIDDRTHEQDTQIEVLKARLKLVNDIIKICEDRKKF